MHVVRRFTNARSAPCFANRLAVLARMEASCFATNSAGRSDKVLPTRCFCPTARGCFVTGSSLPSLALRMLDSAFTCSAASSCTHWKKVFCRVRCFALRTSQLSCQHLGHGATLQHMHDEQEEVNNVYIGVAMALAKKSSSK